MFQALGAAAARSVMGSLSLAGRPHAGSLGLEVFMPKHTRFLLRERRDGGGGKGGGKDGNPKQNMA